MKNLACVIDIETFDTKPTAQIVQLGYAIVDMDLLCITKTGGWSVIPQEGRTADQDTLTWWRGQDQVVKRRVLGNSLGLPEIECDRIPEHLQLFETDDTRWTVWSGPATFDLVILRNAWGSSTPWMWWQERCLSTLRKQLDPDGKLAPKMHGETFKHCGVYDAEVEARYLINLEQHIRSNQP